MLLSSVFNACRRIVLARKLEEYFRTKKSEEELNEAKKYVLFCSITNIIKLKKKQRDRE